MSTPWEILGLTADNADMRSLRRNYARLVKQHRPDQDPEAFREIHEAYAKVLRWLKVRAEHGDAFAACYLPGVEGENASKAWLSILNDDIADASGEAAESLSGTETIERRDDADLPKKDLGAGEEMEASLDDEDVEALDPAASVAADTPFAEAALELEAARRRGDAIAVRESIRKVTDQWRAHLSHTAAWVAVLEAHMDEDPQAVAEVLRTDELLCEIQQGFYHTTCGVLPVWAAGGRWEKIRTMGVALIREEGHLPMPAGAFAMVCWARVSAVIFPQHAQKLADLAYRNLTASTREMAFVDVDVALVMGKEMEGMRLRHRKTIVRCITANKADVRDPDTVAAMSELYFLEGAKLSKQRVFKLFPSFRRLARQGPLGRKQRTASAARSKAGWALGFMGRTWPIWVGVLLLVRLLFVFGAGSSPSSEPPPPFPTPTHINEMRERVDEYWKIQERASMPEWDGEPSPADHTEPSEEYMNNPRYLEHPWLLVLRGRMQFRTIEDVNGGERFIRGEGALKRDSPRYRIMLEVFSEDDSLPPWAQALARQEWTSLSQPKDAGAPGMSGNASHP